MKKTLRGKKGFTLVELMIVVVIMAILVAVAVPIYSAVKGNAEEKTCQANEDIIEKAAIQFMMNGTGEDVLGIFKNGGTSVTYTTAAEAEAAFDEGFIALIDGDFPVCPAGGEITVEANEESLNKTVKVECYIHGSKTE